ncbi:prepilin peptidase [Bacillus lacus]|uniref:Prepilin peptidase n=1 Tax=Metabacillus lacus TaxID=1983721 RepID=A0A7X2IX45_9BACI|nr:A24 family peptidase [Metabacillus lacus]MRX71433.1 prepilin peptidase [Metabacillus lacus]
MLLIYSYIFILGLVLGSFYNVVALRVPQSISIVAPRSACPSCGHTLTATELIPVFSFLFQRGKCRSCRAGISPLYPAMELATAVLFVTAPLLAGWSEDLIVSWSLISLCSIVFLSDLKYMIIPDKVLAFFLALFIAEVILLPLNPWWDSLLGFSVGFFIPFLIILISRGGMGAGDMKFLAVLGVVLGWKLVLLCFMLATFLGTIIGLAGMFMGKIQRGKPFPFGPFLVAGALLSHFFGENMISWYLNSIAAYFYL